MLVLGFTGVFVGAFADIFAAVDFFVLCLTEPGTFDLELGRGVRGFVDPLGAIVGSILE
ncbi:hypothetical protein M7I_4860 [Glarea lozoyensis 74030]|uniref:Uncharacterized protein n=1 Tax=Glarea lozoyensis (strain ATCC 74030 / MF5533) TaxID=1104152 RepID=H0EQB2_GLAL7|nr:hypothetical protein M7I_4860 [Glarea lozoyensis 74030]